MSGPTGPPVFNITVVNGQMFELTDRFNDTFALSLETVDYYRKYGIRSGIIYAAQIGACLAVLIVLLMLTKAEKRKSPVFILNSSALLFNIIGGVMQCLYFTGEWFSPYVYLSGDYFAISQYTKNISIAPGAFACLVVIALEASLVLQLNVVCCTMNSLHKILVMLVSVLMALIAIGYRIAQVAISTKCNIDGMQRCGRYEWVYRAMAISTTISICFFSIAFCAKLGWSLFQRHRLGLTQFGPMQIIFIGGFQTLIIPALFAILQFATDVQEITSNILTVTAISLPLSSLWASGSITKSTAGARGPDAHRKFIVSDSTENGTRNKSIGEAWGGGRARREDAKSEKGSSGRIGVLSSVGSAGEDTPRSAKFPVEAQVARDLEMQEL